MSERHYHRDVFDEIDNPRTVLEKTRTIRTYCCTCFPSKICDNIFLWLIIPFLCISIAVLGALVQNWNIPSPKGSEIPPWEFSEARALVHLNHLSLDIGTRLIGSPKNIETQNYIIDSVKAIAQVHQKNHTRFEVVTRPFDSPFAKNGLNIFVRVSDAGTNPERPSVLVNTHFDSAPCAPGGGDAAVHVGAMIELIRNILSKELPPLNPVIFFFNNGEEVGLLGALAFMKSPEHWVRNVQRFINIDSMSGSGKEIFYRANPGSIVSEYNVPYPHANVIGEEIMAFIPSDSDYTAFVNRSARHSNPNFVLNGIDLALYRYGYFYHTLGDLPKTITPGAVQHIGENMLAMIRSYATLPFGNLSQSRYIYFDVMGLVFVKVPEALSIVMQVILAILFIGTPVFYVLLDKVLFEYLLHSQEKNIQDETKVKRPSILWLMFETSVMMILYLIGDIISLGLCFVFPVLVALISSWLNPMSWFSSTPLAIFLFGFPALLGIVVGQAVTYHVSNILCLKWVGFDRMNKYFIRERFLSLFCLMLIPLSFAVFFSVRAAYLLTIQGYLLWFSITVAMLVDSIFSFLLKKMDVKEDKESFSLMDFGDGRIREEDDDRSKLEYYKDNYWKPEESTKANTFLLFVAKYIWWTIPLFNIIPCVLLLDAYFTLISMLIPTAGRMLMNSDLLVAVFTALAVAYCFVVYLPVLQKTANFTKLIVVLFIGCVAVLIVSFFIFPYAAGSQKRYSFQHELTASFDIVGTQVTRVGKTHFIRANSHDNVNADVGIQFFKGINDTRCEKTFCTYTADIKITPTQLVHTTATEFSLTFQDTSRAFLNFTGSYTDLVSEGDVESPSVFSKKGSKNSSWKFSLTVPPNSEARVELTSYHVDLAHTPYINETVTATPWITVMGTQTFLTQRAIIIIKP